MTENQMLKILDRNPLLIKSIGAYLCPIPLKNLIIYKYWGYINIKKELVHYYKWYDSDPKHPSQELLDLMRSC